MKSDQDKGAGRHKIGNKMKRSEIHQKEKREKAKAKLQMRLARKKAELQDPSLKEARLAANVPRTIENTRVYIGEDTQDKRTMPVQVLDAESMTLDMAGLEDLFGTSESSTEEGKMLLTTSPRPSKEVPALLAEFKSLFGGDMHVDVRIRNTHHYELSKVCKWAAKRGYKALVVVGELHSDGTTITMSKLPQGPTAHFRVTSITPGKAISGHAAPTSHAPELVLSNMSTPLGLSTGRLLQSLFPSLPNFQGRQVVAVHNSRDYIFFRRFRYDFTLREDELSVQRAKERGMDTQVRAKMQEIGPRMTWKLRWIKRGTLMRGRRKANGCLINEEELSDGDDKDAMVDQDAADELAEQIPVLATSALEIPSMEETAEVQMPEASTSNITPIEVTQQTSTEAITEAKKQSKRKHTSKDVKIPQLKVPDLDLEADQRHRRKRPKPGASILDSVNLQGGVKAEEKEWAWKPKMQIKKNRFFL